jgi:GATA zinc finger
MCDRNLSLASSMSDMSPKRMRDDPFSLASSISSSRYPLHSAPLLPLQRLPLKNLSQGGMCTSCKTTTPLWCHNPDDLSLCNACSLFLKLHSITRPLTLRSDDFKRQIRNSAQGAWTHPARTRFITLKA